MPPTFILSQDQTLQFCIDSPTQLESHAGRNRIKPTVDVLLVTGFHDWGTCAFHRSRPAMGCSVKHPSDSPFFHTLVDIFYGVQETTSQSELNRSSITKLLKINELAFLVEPGVLASWVTQYVGQALSRQPLEDNFPKKFVVCGWRFGAFAPPVQIK